MAKKTKIESKKRTKKKFVKNKKSSTPLKWSFYIVLCIAAGFIGWKLGGFYGDWEQSRNDTKTQNQDIEEDFVYPNQVFNYKTKTIKKDIKIKSDWEESKATTNNKKDSLYVINEGKKFDYNDEYITLKNGVVKVLSHDKETSSHIKNVKRVYISWYGTYGTMFAFLTNDGEVYIGRDLIIPNGEQGYTINVESFLNPSLVDTTDKYKEIRKLELGWLSDDTLEAYFIGITTKGRKDLFIY